MNLSLLIKILKSQKGNGKMTKTLNLSFLSTSTTKSSHQNKKESILFLLSKILKNIQNFGETYRKSNTCSMQKSLSESHFEVQNDCQTEKTF